MHFSKFIIKEWNLLWQKTPGLFRSASGTHSWFASCLFHSGTLSLWLKCGRLCPDPEFVWMCEYANKISIFHELHMNSFFLIVHSYKFGAHAGRNILNQCFTRLTFISYRIRLYLFTSCFIHLISYIQILSQQLLNST